MKKSVTMAEAIERGKALDRLAIVLAGAHGEFTRRSISDCCWRSADRLIELGAQQADIDTIRQAFGPYQENEHDHAR